MSGRVVLGVTVRMTVAGPLPLLALTALIWVSSDIVCPLPIAVLAALAAVAPWLTLPVLSARIVVPEGVVMGAVFWRRVRLSIRPV